MYFYKLERTVEGTGEKPEIETPLRSCDLVVTVAGQGAYVSHTDNTPFHDDVINGNIFRVTGHLCGEFTGPRWIPPTKASDAELWNFLWSASE